MPEAFSHDWVVPGTPLETLETVETRRIDTGMDCRRVKDSCASCCPLLENVMLMSREAMASQGPLWEG